MARRSTPPEPHQPVPTAVPSDKPSRFWLFAPFVVLLIAATFWSGYWLWLKGQTVRQLDAASSQFRKAGYELAWREPRVGGYPFRLDVTLLDLRLADPSGWALEVPKFEAEAFAFSPDHWVMAAPGGLTVFRPAGGGVTVNGKVLRASLNNIKATPPSFSLEGSDLVFTPSPGAKPFALARAQHLEFHLRPGPDEQGAVLFKLQGGRATVESLLGRVAGDGPVSVISDSLMTKSGSLRGQGWAAAVRAWTSRGGTLSVRQAGLTAGSAVLGVQSGTLGADADGLLSGKIKISARGVPLFLSALAQDGLISPLAAMSANAVAVANRDTGNLTITFQAGRTTLGPVALGPAPRVY